MITCGLLSELTARCTPLETPGPQWSAM